MPNSFSLPSGCRFEAPLERLIRFMREEYEYYDAVPSARVNHIDPVDIMVTVAVNSFVNSAEKVRAVHRSMSAACDPLLVGIPVDADLRHFELEPVRELLAAAFRGRGVLTAVATKVLHRKRRHLIPMLDKEVVKYYAEALHRPELLSRAVEKHAGTADAAVVVLEAIRSDLGAVATDIEWCAGALAAAGFEVAPLRVFEVLLWTEMEPRGYYRASFTGSADPLWCRSS